ncbi:MAG: preprotein translocase subunit SecG, partial [Alphaproteobacteria bacterium]|nr:preprotein translocase subunit SecG [Alphaproteobacteria bacterium]
MSGRAAASALTKLTWIFAAGFIATSITLTILAAKNAAGDSVIERLGATAAPVAEAPATPAPVATPPADNLAPPTEAGAPATPPKPTQ